MKRRKFFVGMIGMVLALGLVLVGCKNPAGDDDSNNNNNTPSYTEGDVYITALGTLMHYYFSSTPEGLEKAAFDNGITSINPPIKNASWVLNPSLDNNVKNAMDSRGVAYSGTIYVESGITYVIINRKNNGSWYATQYTIN